MIRPQYRNGSIVNLMSSLTLGLDGPAGPYEPLELLRPQTVATAANAVLLVIDGLGYNFLKSRASAFQDHLQGQITSVFPSSTAPAVTSFITGVAPQQHAVSGWFMNLKELGTVAMILPFCPRWGGAGFAFAGMDISRLIACSPVFNALDAQCYFVIHHTLVDSPYTRAGAGCAERVGYRHLVDCMSSIAELARQGSRRKFIYAYWSVFDALSHRYGVESNRVELHFRELERGFAALCQALRGTDTLLIVTADHGFVDTAPEFVIRVEAHPDLAGCLAQPLCGEPRVAYCYTRTAKAALFERYVTEELGDCCDVYPSEELVRGNWFGLGEPEPRLLDRLGDYVLVTKGRHVIKDSLPVEGSWSDIGVHGGASADEMYVPLIVAYC